MRKNGEFMPLEYRRNPFAARLLGVTENVSGTSPDTTDPELTGWAKPEARLRDALERNEFALYCQPMLSLLADAKGEERYPMGEILVRMREEEQAMMPPGEFLPVLEHYGMMPLLDRWVVSNLARNLAQGCRVPRLSMNISSQTLADDEFPKHVAAELKANHVAVESLVFEIEEHDVLKQEALVARFVATMKVVGCGVLIDGFGRKAVSFTPLKTIGAQYVKVDGSIVRKILTSELARTKLNAIIRVGQAINVRVIAECVEEQDVLARLRTLGVGYAQGFGIVQPQPLETLTR
jgi:EAL domain-containing protein (putative c-di-GMP-specific phosphodiesterase class I)